MNPLLFANVNRHFKLFGAIVLTAAVLAGCTAQAAGSAKDSKPAAQEEQIKTVKVTGVTKQKIGDPLEQIADVVSSIQMDIVAKSGGDVQQILKKRGDTVQKGEVILRLDTTDVSLQKEKAQLGMKSAQEQLRKAQEDFNNNKTKMQNGITKTEQALKDLQKSYNKMRNDYDQGLVTKFQLDQLETQLNNNKLDLDMAQKELKTLESTNPLVQLQVGVESSSLSIRESDRSISNMEIKAPTSGIITDLPIEAGMTLSPGFKAGQIQMMDPIKIRADLTEASAALVRGKQEINFYVPGSAEKTKGTVSYLSDVIGAQSKAYQLELEVANSDNKFKPGMKVQLLLTEDNDQIVTSVPTSSIVREAGDTFVFIYNSDNTVEKRKIQLGRLNDLYQEVISGVKENEQLVISGQHQLKDKEKVQLAKQ